VSDDQPLYIEAFWPMPATDFPEDAWKEIHRYIFNGHKPETITKKLVPVLKEWLPYPSYWGGGLYMAKAPYGTYIYHFAVEIEQHRRWNLPAFSDGRKFGRSGKETLPGGTKTWRDANPYPRMARDFHIAWDAGYILGLSEKYAAKCGGWDEYLKRNR
jgi:hypothetical protein